MIGLPRQAVWAAAAALGLLAVFGAYEGWRRGAAGPGDSPAAVGVAATPAANAPKAATAVQEPEAPPPEALTEARVRTIVRQEIQAALHPQPAAATATATAGPSAISPAGSPGPEATAPVR